MTRWAASDIYLHHEAFTAGDQAFREKCDLVFKAYAQSGTTMLIATHDFALAERHCPETLWLDRGRQVSFGPTLRVVERYREYRGGRRAAVLSEC